MLTPNPTHLRFAIQFATGVMDARAGVYVGRLRAVDVIHGRAFTEQSWVLRSI